MNTSITKTFLRFVSLLCFGTFSFPGFSQNLVPNPSFENLIGCPCDDGQLSKIYNWLNMGTSVEAFHSCQIIPCGAQSVDVPANFRGNQAAQDGNGYAGFAFYADLFSGTREYLGMQLPSPLCVGRTYNVSFWVSLADESQKAIDKIGMNFYVGNPGTASINNNPTYYYAGWPVTQSTGWTQISFSFIPSQPYDFFVIGNFHSDGVLLIANINPSGSFNGAYYYVDNVNITPAVPLLPDCSLLPIEIEAFNAIPSNLGVDLSWITNSEINARDFTIERSMNGEDFSPLGLVAASGNSTDKLEYSFFDKQLPIFQGKLFYRLKMTDRDGTSQYSEIITAQIDMTRKQVLIYPNPAKQTSDVSLKYLASKSGLAEITLYTVTGKKLQQFTYPVKEGIDEIPLPTRDLPPGVYMVNTLIEGEQRVSRLIIN